MAHLSTNEEQFIANGVAANVRTDGRGRMELRDLRVEVGVIENCYGSARVRLGETEVLCCISAEIGEVARAGQGRLEVSVTSTPGALSATANLKSKKAQRQQEAFNALLAHEIRQVVHASDTVDRDLDAEVPGPRTGVTCEESDSDDEEAPGQDVGVDYSSLHIRDDRCWILAADVQILRNDGSCLAAASVACRAALLSTKLPKVILHDDVPGDEGLEISGNAADATEIVGVRESLPICVTLAKLNDCIFVDPSLEEEQCPLATYHLGITPSLTVSSLLTSLSSGLSNHPTRFAGPRDISAVLASSLEVAKSLFSSIEDQMKAQQEEGGDD